MYKLSLVPPQILKTEVPEGDIPVSEYVSLCHLGFADLELVGDFEQYRLISRVESGDWKAVRLEKNRLSANFQGSPLWPQRALQRYPALSAFFGLSESSSENVCLIPTVETINRKLQKLMSHDYRFERHKPLNAREYVNRFIDLRALPMAAIEDRDSVHDWSYHFLTFLFTDYLENVRASLKFIRDNLDVFQGEVVRTWNYYGHSLIEGQMRGVAVESRLSHQDAVFQQMAISLDVCTAKIVQILCLKERDLLEKCRSEVSFLETFLSPINEAALKKHLWLEPEIDALLERLPPTPSVRAEKLEAHLDRTLVALERRAQLLLCREASLQRVRYFHEILGMFWREASQT